MQNLLQRGLGLSTQNVHVSLIANIGIDEDALQVGITKLLPLEE